MAVTVQELIYKARALLDEYTDDGTIILESEVADIEAKMILFIDMGQKELYRTGRVFETYEFTHKPIDNLLGDGFDIEEFTGDTQYYPDENGTDEAKSYYIEADQTHTIEIQELEGGSWSTLTTHTGTAQSAFTAYKGNITVSTTGNAVRMKISGTTYFRHINRAFFEYQFVTVPDYRPWVQKAMPSDFRILEEIVAEYPTKMYSKVSAYKWEEPNKLYIDWNFEGTYRIKYKPVPATITAKTDTLEIDDITAEALSYFAASWVAPYENQSMTNPLFQKFAELKAESFIEQPAAEETIEDVYPKGDYYA